MEGIGYGVAPRSSVKGLTVGVPGAMGWPEAVEVPRAVAGELCCGGAPDPWGRQRAAQVPGALAQEVICGHTTGFWGRGQTAAVHRAAQGDTPSVDAPAVWQRRRAVGETGPGTLPGLWGTSQPVYGGFLRADGGNEFPNTTSVTETCFLQLQYIGKPHNTRRTE